MTSYGDIVRSGLWWNNPGLVQLLGLCPLLAVSRSALLGFSLGLATVAVLCATNVLIALTRRLIDPRLRLPACMLVIASFVTAVDLLFEAYAFDLYRQIGLFVPLIVTNCVILARAEGFAARNAPLPAFVDGLAHGAGFLAVLVVLGAIREWLGTQLVVATLPAGGFFVLAALIALRNVLLARRQTAAAERR